VILRKFAALIGDENRPVQPDYENIVEKIYDADYIPVKFNDVENTLRQINGEVARKTNGQIREALTRDELFRVSFFY
jgi:serine protease inhibitor